MAGEWRAVRIADLGRVVTGRTPPGNDPAYYGADVPFLTPSDVGDQRRVERPGRCLSKFGAAQLARCLVHGGVGVSCIGWQMGKAVLIDRPTITNQQINSIVVEPDVADARFVYYSLRNRRAELFGLGAGGSRTPILNKGDFERLPFVLPPLGEQRAIAHILGTLDDKIELNRRVNETMEAMARALFKSWFVDFDPVRAKADGRDPGLPKPLADLFPARLVDSELGEIPEGWEVKSLDQIARFLNGLALQKYPPVGGRSLPVIKIAQLRAGNTDGADRASADLEAEYVVHDGEILFSWSGSLECRLWAGGPGALNQHLFKVTSDVYPRWLCYLGIHQHLGDFRHIAAGKATTMGHIQRHHLSDAKLPIPQPALLRAMNLVIGPIVESTWRRAVQSRTLAAIRDTLLPKLISGEVRVPQAMMATCESLDTA